MQINAMNSETNLDCFKVYVRIRPLSEKEMNSLEKIISNNKIKRYPRSILVREDNLLFVLDPDSLEYNIKNNIDNVLKGFNSTALAYGVTGTGKTHTIFGDMRRYVQNYDYFINKEAFNEYKNDENISNHIYNLNENKDVNENQFVKIQDNFNLQKFIEDAGMNGEKFEIGVCVHAVDYLFNQIAISNNKIFKIKISYLEIYNEQVIDLLVEKSPPLMIVEDAQKGVLVPDLTELAVNNSSELIKFIIEGNQRRAMAETGQNQFSSRSHAILQILVEQRSKIKDIKEEYLVSKFLLVDLAGSERGGLEKGIRTHEGKNINKSLLSLGNCINILSDKSKKGAFVPYRDSKLTRLLKDSLGGNIMTVMIACVSPAAISYDETVNTLKYAMRARKIEKKITKNIREVDVHISQYKDIIDSLKSEIEQLKQIIKEQQTIILKGNTIYDTKEGDEYSKDKESELNEKNYIKHKKLKSSEKKDNNTFQNEFESPEKIVKDLSIMKKSTESIDLFKNKELKVYQSDNMINTKMKNENGDDIKAIFFSNNGYFKSDNDLKTSTKIDNKKNIKENSLYNSASQSNKITYGSLYKKRNSTQSNINDSRNRNNISKRLTSEYRENKNNITSPNSINIKDFDINGYKSFINKSVDDDINIEELEKHVENLNNDKFFIEDLLEKGTKTNSSIVEKYQTIKSCYEKYLHYINEKLIQNIEESMILKFNLKEILDLNLTNQNNINTLTNQIYNLQKLILDKNGENIQSIEDDIAKLNEEIKNVNNAIEENDNLKEKIGESLKKNLRFKDFLKKILLKLISKSQKKENNLEEAYLKIIKEREELEKKNKTYEKHLSNILKEKHLKESKLDKVEDELNRLKKVIAEKDKLLKNKQTLNIKEKNIYANSYSKNNVIPNRGRDFSKNNKKKYLSSISLEKNNLYVKDEKNILNHQMKIAKKDTILINNITNSINNIYDENLTEQDKIEINLQDEYFGTKKKFINDINNVSIKNINKNHVNNNYIKETINTNSINNIVADKDDYKIEIDLENLISNKNTTINNQANIQNIKYIINQTNNIVNNNINRIVEKDNQNKRKSLNNKYSCNSVTKFSSSKYNPKNSLNLRESYKEKIKDAMNLNIKDCSDPHRKKLISVQKSPKKQSIISNNEMDFYEEKILKTNNIDFNEKDSLKIRNFDKINPNSPKRKLINEKINSQSNLSKNKDSENLREYNKIIENQLNEVYNKKAREIGEKIKRNIKSANYSNNKFTKKISNQIVEKSNQISSIKKECYNKNDSINEKDIDDKTHNLNRSLSISCVSINQEVGFCSELDIVDQINDKDILPKAEYKNTKNAKKPTSDSNALLNSRYNKKYKKISIIKSSKNYHHNLLTGHISKNNDQIINNRDLIDKDYLMQNNEFMINQENIIKISNLKEDNSKRLNINEELSPVDSNNLVNKKPSFNINPSPIKIENNFSNNLIIEKKIKPINFNSSTEYKNNGEKYINFSKNIDRNKIINQDISNIKENIEEDVIGNNIKQIMKKNELSIEKNSENTIKNINISQNNINKDTLKNSEEKSKKGLINLIPFNKNLTNSDISNKKVTNKFNSNKTLNSNTLLNSAEIKEEILINVSNLNSNRNKQRYNNLNDKNKPVTIPVSNGIFSNVDIEKFINSANNNERENINSDNQNINDENNIDKHNLDNPEKNISNTPNENLNDEYDKRNNPELRKYISEKDIQYFFNDFNLVKNKTNKNNLNVCDNQNNPELNTSKEKSENNNNNRAKRERSSSILRKARIERKITKNNEQFEIESPNKKVENLQNKSLICNRGNEYQDISSNKMNKHTSRCSSTNRKNQHSSNKINTFNSERNLNNFKYLKNNFNSYKTKKLENNMIRKGSNISKHSVDFVNEYINQKKNKKPINSDGKKEDLEKILVYRESQNNLSSYEKEKQLVNKLDNIAAYDVTAKDLKALFINTNNKNETHENSESNINCGKIKVKKFISSNLLSNDFTNKFLSNVKEDQQK